MNLMVAVTRRLPAAGLPPWPKPPSVRVDSPKKGELRLPTGGARFVRFKRFWKLTEKVRL